MVFNLPYPLKRLKREMPYVSGQVATPLSDPPEIICTPLDIPVGEVAKKVAAVQVRTQGRACKNLLISTKGGFRHSNTRQQKERDKE